MTYIPQSTKTKIGFRNTASSKLINDIQDNMLSDILNLFMKTNKLEKEFDYIKEVNTLENTYLIQNLQRLNVLQENMTNATYCNIYTNSMIIDNNSLGTFIDNNTMTVTLPELKSTSKLSLYDDVLNEVFLPESLKVTVSPEASDIIIDTDILSPLKENNEYFIRKVIADNNTNEVYMEYIIELPEDIISNREINCIKLDAFPFKSTDVIGIYYTFYGDWNLIPSFNMHSLSEEDSVLDELGSTRFVIKESSPLRFDFKNIIARKIKITLRQKNSITIDNKKVFCLGIKNLKILSNDYNKNTASFKFSKDFGKNVIIKDIKTILNNLSEVDNLNINHEFYYINAEGAEIKINTPLPFSLNSSTLVVKTNFSSDGITPNISKIQIYYE